MSEMQKAPDLIKKYFPQTGETALKKLEKLADLYQKWNQKINVISRKDISHINERHILHSLSLARVVQFKPGAEILDVGTGGGLPGIPLAIMFPDTQFHLIDSIGKKIKVVEAIAADLHLSNVKAEQVRGEKIKTRYDFITSRAVTNLPRFFFWTKGKIKKASHHPVPNGILYLKGGDFEDELQQINWKSQVYPLSNYFDEPFFDTKKIVHLYP